MLNISHEYPQAPLVQIDKSLIPGIPNHDARVQYIAPDIVAQIINTAVVNANKNPLRMFLFNLLSQNNWLNPYFQEVFDLCVANILHSVTKSSATPESVMFKCIDTMMSLYTSSLVYVFPELQNLISRDLFDSSSRNAGVLHELKKEMSVLNNVHNQGMNTQSYGYFAGPPGHGQPVMHHQQPVQGPMMQVWDPRVNAYVLVPQQMVSQPVQQPMMHPGMRAQRPYAGSTPYGQFVNQPVTALDYTGNEGLRSYRTSSGSVSSSNNQESPQHNPDQSARDQIPRRLIVNDGEVITSQTLASRQTLAARQTDFHKQTKPVPAELLETDFSKAEVISTQQLINQVKGESEVDRSKHELPGSSISSGSNTAVTENHADNHELEVQTVDSIQAQLSLKELVATFRSEVLEQDNSPVVRKNGLILDAVISKLDVKSHLSKWLNHLTFGELCFNMQKTINGISKETELVETTLSLIRELDCLFTFKINDFLKNTVGSDINIDSAFEDYPDLAVYLSRNVSGRARDKLIKFADGLISVFNSQSFSSVFPSGKDMLDIPNNENAYWIPSTCAMISIPYDRVSLGLKSHLNPAEVDPAKQKLIYNSVKPLFLDEDADNVFEAPIEKVYIVTRDGAVYRVTNHIDSDTVFVTAVL